MQHIEFRSIRREFPVAAAREAILPFVGGVPLPDLLGRIERTSAVREGKPELAGSYAGLIDESVRWPGRHYLGEPVLTWFGDGDTVLLGCECGEWGCWPFTAMVTVDRDAVVWSGYRNGHRDWDYSELWDLVFERTQYEEAVRATVH